MARLNLQYGSHSVKALQFSPNSERLAILDSASPQRLYEFNLVAEPISQIAVHNLPDSNFHNLLWNESQSILAALSTNHLVLLREGGLEAESIELLTPSSCFACDS